MSIDAVLTRPPNCDVTFDGSSRQNPSILQGTLMPQSLRSSAHFIPRHRFEPTADTYFGGGSVMNEAVLNKLERRLGRLHAKLRLGIEMDHEAQIFGQGINFFHIENWCSVHSVIRTTLKLMGLYWRGRKCGADPGQTQSYQHEDTTEPLRWLHSTAY